MKRRYFKKSRSKFKTRRSFKGNRRGKRRLRSYGTMRGGIRL